MKSQHTSQSKFSEEKVLNIIYVGFTSLGKILNKKLFLKSPSDCTVESIYHGRGMIYETAHHLLH